MVATAVYKSTYPIRIVTAASLFDGHDAAINIIRRLLQRTGAEVIHLGHNRSVEDIVTAAIQEDAQAICISSYQGGHMEYFKYTLDLLRERGAGHVLVFGGGGGVIVPEEREELHQYGVSRIYSPEDGQVLGLQGIINDIMERCDFLTVRPGESPALDPENPVSLARMLTRLELNGRVSVNGKPSAEDIVSQAPSSAIPVIGLTGTGGAGKSSLTDELLLRLLRDFPEIRVGVVAVDPSRKTTGGALLGDRLRFNAIDPRRVFMRSLATRDSHDELSAATGKVVRAFKAAGYSLIFVETSGIGQSDAAIIDIAGLTVYVTTREYGAASQLEKIEMLEHADLTVINKFERMGSEDALRDIRKQVRRNKAIPFSILDEDLPVFGTIASQYNDPGVNHFYLGMLKAIDAKFGTNYRSRSSVPGTDKGIAPRRHSIIPEDRTRYLKDVVTTCHEYRKWAEEQIDLARRLNSVNIGLNELRKKAGWEDTEPILAMEGVRNELMNQLDPKCRELLARWGELRAITTDDEFVYHVRGKEIRIPTKARTLSGTNVPKVLVPDHQDWGARLRYLLLENTPGEFPYAAGVYPFKRSNEDPRRQFAGEGTPERTNARFHYLARNDEAKRLSTAFDSVTLYGEDPHERPDIYGKVGNSGTSVCTLEDMKKLYAGFDLCDPMTSVSMTINGPAPIILAMFFNAAICQQEDKFRAENSREPTEAEAAGIRMRTLQTVRGTVQADILKEDQAQNTCIFSIDFALRMQGDIQEFFVRNQIRNYYSVSISGYHIAEAGANPITQTAFTLANGFTFVEYFLSRGLPIDSFAPNLSFFFSNGLDIEYSVIGRVARRIWAVAIRDRYKGNERSQMLKYHIQTSGRSLHAQEVAFNDIRTTLQALLAMNDNCNSLHTNAYDEAVTTPTEESVRRAMAIQLVISKEFGLSRCENNLQGAHIIDWLTDEVEKAVLEEFERLDRRGGVLGAMETQYQRSRIQEESMTYELQKNSGELPIIGVNTFLGDPEMSGGARQVREVVRSSEEEKRHQIRELRAFQQRHPEKTEAALRRLQEVVISGGNTFEELVETVKVASLGQISDALYQVGGRYRRAM